MQVNNIQNHNTNFGMALKINPKLKPQLQSAHFATVERLQKIGKEVENVKLYDVCYENDIYTDLKKNLPKVGHNVETPQGTGKVVSIDVFNNTYSVDLKEKGIIKIAGDNNKDGNDK